MRFSAADHVVREKPLVSIIVNNRNYGNFLSNAIDSALLQTYAPLEVVVVDDGSTDNSRDVIAGYGERIVTVLKENGGQASAFNAGLAASLGDILIFLDADDALLPEAAALAVEQFARGTVKVHWPLMRTDETLEPTGQLTPPEDLPAGDFRRDIFRFGPATSLSPPTSGNAWARSFLELVMPIPEQDHRIAADGYLYGLAPGFGDIGRVTTPQGFYRIHGTNNYRGMKLDERLRLGMVCIEHQWRVLRAHARKNDIAVDEPAWERHSYFHQLQAAAREIESVIPPATQLILLDEARWSIEGGIAGRMVIPFPESDGYYAGPPENDSAAIDELERIRKTHGAQYFVIAAPAFWWLECYSGFAEHLRSHYVEILANDRLIILNLEK